jgi:hypothetical protein
MPKQMVKVFSLAVGLLALVGMVALVALPGSEAQEGPDAGAVKLPPPLKLEVSKAVSRTLAEMEQMDAELGPNGPDFPGETVKPFRPTMDLKEYQQYKELMKQLPAQERPAMPEAAGPLGPPLKVTEFEGVDQPTAGNWRPPDTHGAVGLSHFVEVTNSHIDMYSKSTGAKVKGVSLASFFNYTTTSLFDPRATFDTIWRRWVVTADARPLSDGTQYFFVAISLTSDPLGAYWVYRITIFGANTSKWFWDYPMVGWDQDALIFTANVFNSSGYQYSRIMVGAKAKMYNGWAVSLYYWNLSGVGTIAAPIVLDQNPYTYCLNAPGYTTAGTVMRLYSLQNTARWPASMWVSNITVPGYQIPPPAKQPLTTATLDTLDARFVNNSYQVGNSLYNVHTINASGYPTPRFYEFTTSGATATVKQQKLFWATATSHDWNASLAVNPFNRNVFATWSATSPTGTVFNARVYYGGRLGTDALNAFYVGGYLSVGSATYYTQWRWGDYSAVSLDPYNHNYAWIVNERIKSNTVWGSRIGNIRY